MADGAQRYGYGSSLQVLTVGGLQLASVVGSKPNGRMVVRLHGEKREIAVCPFGNAWIEEVDKAS